MFTLNDDLSIYATRGDIVFFAVEAEDEGEKYQFRAGDMLRMKIYGKKNAENVVLQKDFPVTVPAYQVGILLTEEDTKIGEVISKPMDYWYEVELNPHTNPQTIIGYDEDGAKVFKLFPEGADLPEFPVEPEDVPVVDDELDMVSTRPVQNQAIARAVVSLRADFEAHKETVTAQCEETAEATAQAQSELNAAMEKLKGELEVERARVNNIVALEEGSTTGDAELADARTDTNGITHSCLGEAVRKQFNAKQDLFAEYKPLDLEIVADTLYNVTSLSTLAMSYGQYAECKVAAGMLLKVSGYSYSSSASYPAAAFFDADNNIVATIGAGAPNTAFTDFHVIVPNGAVKLVVNGKKWTSDACVKEGYPKDLNELDDKVNHIRPEQFLGCVNVSERTVTHSLNAENTKLLKSQMYNDRGEIVSGEVSGNVYDTILYPIEGIWVRVDLSNYPMGSYGGAFLDEEFGWISSFSTATTDEVYKQPKEVPLKAKFIAITKLSTNTYKDIYVQSLAYQFDGLMVDRANLLSVDSTLKGKKVVWLGTSVSHGQYAEKAYPQEAANRLGFELVNCSVPGLATHTNADGSMKTYGSLVLSKAECEAQGMEIPDAPIAYTPGGSYNNYYRTYENVFCEANADADMYVFDIVPNNTDFSLDDWNGFDFTNWCYNDGSAFEDHRSTFLGALLFLMDKMYALNENARMVFVLGSGFAYWNGKTAFQTMKDKWNIPCIDLWGKVNTSPKSLDKLRSKDGTDPHPSTLAHEIMGRMLAHDLESVY